MRSSFIVDCLQQSTYIQFSLRALARAPIFTVVTVLILALGIGANTTIFSLINALLLRTLPVQDPQELVAVSTARPDGQEKNVPLAMLEEIEKHQQVFSTLSGVEGSDGDRIVTLDPLLAPSFRPILGSALISRRAPYKGKHLLGCHPDPVLLKQPQRKSR